MSYRDLPSDRSARARIAAWEKAAQGDTREHTAAAREKSPAKLDYFLGRVDPDGVLPLAERTRRAEAARKAHFTRMALRSAQVRRERARR